MRQHFLNLVALAVIGMGGAYLSSPQPAAAQFATTLAECTGSDGSKCAVKVAEGECCNTNEDGTCSVSACE